MNSFSGQCTSLKFTLEMMDMKILKLSNFSVMKFYFAQWKEKVATEYANYQDSKLIITPLRVGGNSERDYKEQLGRINEGLSHVWDDTKHNTAVVGDYFGYAVNQKKLSSDSKTDGSIEIYKIIGICRPSERLSMWSDNVGQGDRNVVVLSSKCFYKGTLRELKKAVNYSPNYNVQGTICISSGKVVTYFDRILN